MSVNARMEDFLSDFDVGIFQNAELGNKNVADSDDENDFLGKLWLSLNVLDL